MHDGCATTSYKEAGQAGLLKHPPARELTFSLRPGTRRDPYIGVGEAIN
jgi:hypothetical protein